MRYSISVLFCLLTIISCEGKKRSARRVHSRQSLIRRGIPLIKNNDAKKAFLDGMNFIERDKYEEAEICFLKADSIEPNNVTILNSLGNVIGSLETPDSSFIYFKLAIEIDSSDSKAYTNYGYWLNRDIRYEEAITIMRRGLRISKADLIDSQLFYLNLAWSYHQLRQNSIASVLLDSASTSQQNDKTASMILEERQAIGLSHAQH